MAGGIQTEEIRWFDRMNQQFPYDARAVANFVLDRADHLAIGVSNLHIIKILYYAHGHFLALLHKRLIDQAFEAWEYGPVVQDIYQRFKRHGKASITERATILNKRTGIYVADRPMLDVGDENLLGNLVDFYVRIPPG